MRMDFISHGEPNFNFVVWFIFVADKTVSFLVLFTLALLKSIFPPFFMEEEQKSTLLIQI